MKDALSPHKGETMNLDYKALRNAIDTRRSRRKYLGTPIAKDTAAQLQQLIDHYSKAGNIRMELVLNDSASFNKFTKSYGMFSGVNDYIALIARDDDPTAKERIGYYGELVVLEATNLGLGTCWVGISNNAAMMPFKLKDGEKLACSILVGNVADDYSTRERLMRNITHRKLKPIESMYIADKPIPKWFKLGMVAVQRAPSAVNRQPVTFHYKDDTVTAKVPNYDGPYEAFDLGIAKAHFEIGTGSGSWQWGNGAKFAQAEDTSKP